MLLVALVVAAMFGGAGCGRSDSDKAKEQAQGFFTDLNHGDTASACKRLTDKQRQSLDIARLGGCKNVLKNGPGKLPSIEFPQAKKVDLNGDKGKVEVTGSGGATAVVSLRKEGGDWKVDDFSSSGG